MSSIILTLVALHYRTFDLGRGCGPLLAWGHPTVFLWKAMEKYHTP